MPSAGRRPALAREIVCTLPEHIHTDACYTQLAQTEETVPTCSLTSLGIHRHISSCYDDGGGLICGYADFVIHHHDETCYTEDGTLWCPLPEVPVHQHTAACYQTEESSAPEAEEPDDWGEADGSFAERMIDAFETEDSADQTETKQVLVCGMQETALHRHTDDCFDADGNWICGKLQIIRHQHDETCCAKKRFLPAVRR